MHKLDIGSGHNPRGNVNIDLFKTYAHSSPNFLLAHACYLPFRNKVFSETSCIHVLEHIPEPAQAIKESIRVTQNQVLIKCPYRNLGFHRVKGQVKAGTTKHLWGFNKTWFLPIQRRYPKTEISYSSFYILPLEITVEINLK